MPSDPLGYGPSAPTALSTDNPTYASIADNSNNYQNSTPTSMTNTYSTVTLETSCELDDEPAEREFDNPLYGTPERDSHDLSHDQFVSDQNVLAYSLVNYYKGNESQVPPNALDSDDEVAI